DGTLIYNPPRDDTERHQLEGPGGARPRRTSPNHAAATKKINPRTRQEIGNKKRQAPVPIEEEDDIEIVYDNRDDDILEEEDPKDPTYVPHFHH
ncbi:unnamed protein product, partial [Auanema sp. JU1783]